MNKETSSIKQIVIEDIDERSNNVIVKGVDIIDYFSEMPLATVEQIKDEVMSIL